MGILQVASISTTNLIIQGIITATGGFVGNTINISNSTIGNAIVTTLNVNSANITTATATSLNVNSANITTATATSLNVNILTANSFSGNTVNTVNLNMTGSLSTNGSFGTVNQVFSSQGPGLPPIWKDTSGTPDYIIMSQGVI